MKKILLIASIITAPLLLNAQEAGVHQVDKEIFKICSAIFIVALFMLFFVTIIKKIIEYRLKNKIVEKGIPESIISSILQTNPNEDRNSYLKWGAILAGIGIGFTLINYNLPLGFHSLAIMAFCIALSFIGYYLLAKHFDK